jgi:hypothetical protein
MKFSWINTRRSKLRIRLEPLVLINDIDGILAVIDEYEKDNLSSIEKLNRKRIADARKINGALKQTINSHGPITKLLIGSATKRIMGALMVEKPEDNILIKIKKWLGLN